MTKRKIDAHEGCLRQFGKLFKSTVKENLSFWKKQDLDRAEARAAAFELVRADLIRAAESSGTPIQDIGIEDFNIPKVNE